MHRSATRRRFAKALGDHVALAFCEDRERVEAEARDGVRGAVDAAVDDADRPRANPSRVPGVIPKSPPAPCSAKPASRWSPRTRTSDGSPSTSASTTTPGTTWDELIDLSRRLTGRVFGSRGASSRRSPDARSAGASRAATSKACRSDRRTSRCARSARCPRPTSNGSTATGGSSGSARGLDALGKDGRLRGSIRIKDGDSSTFVAVRTEEPKEPIPPPPSYRDKWRRRW